MNYFPRYRADIDGLRAIAVILVFLYHLKCGILSGGFVGVDVFFVISGYLITGIIIRKLYSNEFSISDFLNRRIKRIIPNVFLISIVTIISGYFILLPNDYSALIYSFFYTSIYSANIYFLNATGAYFSSSSNEMPLLHMWSLAVEEQFYFIWPLLLIALFKTLKGKHLGLLAIFMAIISFVVSNIISQNDSGYAYYIFYTRSGGLLLGAALALLQRDYKIINKFNSKVASIVGLVFILYPAINLTNEDIYPGFNSLLPCLGAFLLIASGTGNKRNFITSLLSSKLFVWVGGLSFSIYLWHWPLIAFSHYLDIIDDIKTKVTILIATVILSYISHKIIENPIRRSSLSFIKSFFVINVSFIITASFIVYLSNVTGGFDYRFKDQALNIGKVDVRYAGLDEGWCHVSSEARQNIQFTNELASCFIGSKSGSKSAIYIGDSNAGHYAPFVDEIARQAGVKVKQLSTSSCWPTLTPIAWGENADLCKKFRELAISDIASKKYDYVIVANNWERDNKFYSYKNEDFHSLFKFYSQNAKKVIVLAQMPEWDKDPAACFKRGQCNVLDKFNTLQGMNEANDKLKLAAKDFNNIEVIDPSYTLIKDGMYTPFAMGSVMYHDFGHVSIRGMKWVTFKYLKDNNNPLP
ncbi:acyltransferase family protein [Aeromonas enteropelogenes]|uniref:acyltransferase family protein n=1 Tax=Aeromonas enteropelogenes TaxID=29489 RepID=UPI003B9E2D52